MNRILVQCDKRPEKANLCLTKKNISVFSKYCIRTMWVQEQNVLCFCFQQPKAMLLNFQPMCCVPQSLILNNTGPDLGAMQGFVRCHKYK